MSGLWKSDEELRQERWHEELRSDLNQVATQHSQDIQEATAQHTAAMERAARIQATATVEALGHQTSEVLNAIYAATGLVESGVKRAIAEGWLLQAEEKTQRAEELWFGGMAEEALRLAEEAIQQDPSHLRAYGLAAVLHDHEGRPEEAYRLYRKQIGLLRILSYRQDLQMAIQVLQALPSREGLLAEYASCIRTLLGEETWAQGDWEGMIRLLMDRGMRDLAAELAAMAITRLATLKIHALHVELTTCSGTAREALLAFASAGGFSQQKMHVGELEQLRRDPVFAAGTVDAVHQALLEGQLETLKSEPALENYVFHLEFSRRWGRGQESLAAHLAAVTEVEQQNAHLLELGDLFRREGASQDPTLLLVRAIVARQFETWRPSRQQHLEQTAVERAKKAVKGVGQMLGFLVLLPTILICLSGFASAESGWSRFGFFITAVVAVVGAFLGWSVIYDQSVQRRAQREREQLDADESQWTEWLGLAA